MASEPYQSLERLRARIDFEPDDLFGESANAEKRFDRLLMGEAAVGDAPKGDGWRGLEAEARDIIENLSGDIPYNREPERVDEVRAPDTATIQLAYPVNSVATVEVKRTLRDDYEELRDYQYDVTDHHLIAEFGTRAGQTRQANGSRRPVNELLYTTQRMNWRDRVRKVRVTYDRGYEEVPYQIQSAQADLVGRAIRKMRADQTFAAASPDEFAGVSPEFDDLLTDEIRRRIEDTTSLSGSARAL